MNDKDNQGFMYFKSLITSSAPLAISGAALIVSIWGTQTTFNYTEKAIHRATYNEIINAFAEYRKNIESCAYTDASKDYYSALAKREFIENNDIRDAIDTELNNYEEAKSSMRDTCLKQKKCLYLYEEFYKEYEQAQPEERAIISKKIIAYSGKPPEITDLNENSAPEYNIPFIQFGTDPTMSSFLTPEANSERSSTGVFSVLATMTGDEQIACQNAKYTKELEKKVDELKDSFSEKVVCLMANDLEIDSASCHK